MAVERFFPDKQSRNGQADHRIGAQSAVLHDETVIQSLLMRLSQIQINGNDEDY